MSKMPDQKPWKRPAGTREHSRGIILDLQDNCDWKMPSTVMLHSNDIALSLEDNMQVQCLPVFGSDRPQWTYIKLPKVTEFRNFGRIPPWCRRPQKMTYHLCAEDMTKTAIVPNLPEEDRDDLINRGILPRESSAKDRRCVMCPIKGGSPRLLPCCLCYNWCHIGCSYQTHLGRVCPCHVQILDPKRKIIVLRRPYHEDCVVLPTRTTMRVDNKSIAQEARYRTQPDDTRWSPASWLNTLLEKHAWLSAGLVWVQGASM